MSSTSPRSSQRTGHRAQEMGRSRTPCFPARRPLWMTHQAPAPRPVAPAAPALLSAGSFRDLQFPASPSCPSPALLKTLQTARCPSGSRNWHQEPLPVLEPTQPSASADSPPPPGSSHPPPLPASAHYYWYQPHAALLGASPRPLSLDSSPSSFIFYSGKIPIKFERPSNSSHSLSVASID